MTDNLVTTTQPAPLAATDRDNAGRFQPGHRAPGPGRPKKETETAILNAITGALDADEITNAIRTALDLAIEQKSARGIVSVLELCASYGVGRPTIRVEQPTSAFQAVLMQLRQSADESEQA